MRYIAPDRSSPFSKSTNTSNAWYIQAGIHPCESGAYNILPLRNSLLSESRSQQQAKYTPSEMLPRSSHQDTNCRDNSCGPINYCTELLYNALQDSHLPIVQRTLPVQDCQPDADEGLHGHVAARKCAENLGRMKQQGEESKIYMGKKDQKRKTEEEGIELKAPDVLEEGSHSNASFLQTNDARVLGTNAAFNVRCVRSTDTMFYLHTCLSHHLKQNELDTSLGQLLYQQSCRGDCCDICFRMNKATTELVYCHRCVLEARICASVLNTMIASNCLKSGPGVLEIQLAYVTRTDCLEAILELIYTGRTTISIQAANEVLEIAKHWHIHISFDRSAGCCSRDTRQNGWNNDTVDIQKNYDTEQQDASQYGHVDGPSFLNSVKYDFASISSLAPVQQTNFIQPSEENRCTNCGFTSVKFVEYAEMPTTASTTSSFTQGYFKKPLHQNAISNEIGTKKYNASSFCINTNHQAYNEPHDLVNKKIENKINVSSEEFDETAGILCTVTSPVVSKTFKNPLIEARSQNPSGEPNHLPKFPAHHTKALPSPTPLLSSSSTSPILFGKPTLDDSPPNIVIKQLDLTHQDDYCTPLLACKDLADDCDGNDDDDDLQPVLLEFKENTNLSKSLSLQMSNNNRESDSYSADCCARKLSKQTMKSIDNQKYTSSLMEGIDKEEWLSVTTSATNGNNQPELYENTWSSKHDKDDFMRDQQPSTQSCQCLLHPVRHPRNSQSRIEAQTSPTFHASKSQRVNRKLKKSCTIGKNTSQKDDFVSSLGLATSKRNLHHSLHYGAHRKQPHEMITQGAEDHNDNSGGIRQSDAENEIHTDGNSAMTAGQNGHPSNDEIIFLSIIRNNTVLYEKVLLQKPLQLQDLLLCMRQEGLVIREDRLMQLCDSHGITFITPRHHRGQHLMNSQKPKSAH